MMQVAKGRTLGDGTYLFTCGTCGGKASEDKSVECAWCYGGDARRISAEMKTARGQRYYGLLKSLLAVNGKAMVDEFHRLAKAQGKATGVEVGYISLKYGLNFKATWEWLYETRCIRLDYDDVSGNFKVRDVYAAARNKYPELVEAQP